MQVFSNARDNLSNGQFAEFKVAEVERAERKYKDNMLINDSVMNDWDNHSVSMERGYLHITNAVENYVLHSKLR